MPDLPAIREYNKTGGKGQHVEPYKYIKKKEFN